MKTLADTLYAAVTVPPEHPRRIYKPRSLGPSTANALPNFCNRDHFDQWNQAKREAEMAA